MIVQLNPGTTRGAAAPLVRELGGKVTRDLHIINAVAAELPAAGARELASRPEVRAVSPNAADASSQATATASPTSYNASIQTPYLWNTYRGTGRGVGVAVVDTGIAGDLPDFRASSLDKTSRVIASAVVNPDATTAGDTLRPRHARRRHHRRRFAQPRRRRRATRAATWASPRPRT